MPERHIGRLAAGQWPDEVDLRIESVAPERTWSAAILWIAEARAIRMLGEYVLLDAITIVTCVFLLVRYAQLNHSSPALFYIFFHLYTFSERLFFVYMGSPTLFENDPVYEPIKYEELARAMLLADGALLLFTLGCIRASLVSPPVVWTTGHVVDERSIEGSTLSLRNIWCVALVAFPIGVVGLLLFTNIPGLRASMAESALAESNWFTMTASWSGLALMALIYVYGFRMSLMMPLIVYLLLMLYQGFHRYRVILPMIMLTQIYLDRRAMRWPQLRVVVLGVVLLLAFFPMKLVGRLLRDGVPIAEVVNSSGEMLATIFTGEHADMTFMDQLASAMTLLDDSGSFQYGRCYVGLVTLPVPRQWWPEKPGVNEHLKLIETPTRPMAKLGMIVTLPGELYINFGVAGVLAGMFLVGNILTKFQFYAYSCGYFSVSRFYYIMIASNLFQIYRDGLMSIVLFTCVNMMPLMIIIILHYFFPARPHLARRLRPA